MKYPRTHRCWLCGRRFAALPSTWHVSAFFRIRMCRTCTDITFTTMRQLRRTLRMEPYAEDARDLSTVR